MAMDLRKLRYFAVTAAEGSFHQASGKLHIAQPALSRQIRDLEAEIGGNLFVRSSQGVTLTPAGEILLADVQRLLPQIELAKETAKRAVMGQFGVLKIGLTTVVGGMRFAISAFAAARRLNPDVDYRLSLITSDNQVAALQRGDIDVGLLYRREPLAENMSYRDLRVDHYVLAVPSDHRLTRLEKVKLADLEGEKLLVMSRATRPITYDELMAACLKGGLSPNIALELHGEGEGITMNLVAEGLMLAFFNREMSIAPAPDGVTFLRIEDLDIKLTLAAMWCADRESGAAHDFIDLVVEHMNNMSPKCDR